MAAVPVPGELLLGLSAAPDRVAVKLTGAALTKLVTKKAKEKVKSLENLLIIVSRLKLRSSRMLHFLYGVKPILKLSMPEVVIFKNQTYY
jgi:hypothetical protein